MFCRSFCAAITGVSAQIIKVEADITEGLPMFHMVGYLGSEVKEAAERVRSAIKNMGYNFQAKRITVNLSPADIRKEGTAFDLSVAMALMASFGYISDKMFEKIMFIGELSLDGHINGVPGVLAMVSEAKKQGFKYCVVPEDNIKEAILVEGMRIIGTGLLSDIVELIMSGDLKKHVAKSKVWEVCKGNVCTEKDFSDIYGQHLLKRAVQIAVSGRHNMLIIGPPGVGKTMLAERIPGIMPPLTKEESIETAIISSICGEYDKLNDYIYERPVRTPHYSISQAGLIGGGNVPKPGEITRAHRGILFLDELTEFKRSTLELLRGPLESKKIVHTRMNRSITYPCDFMLIAAMNPCPCGYYPDIGKCRCTPDKIRRYLGKISHAFLDRIDIIVEAEAVKYHSVGDLPDCRERKTVSDTIRDKVISAEKIQHDRYSKDSIRNNSELNAKQIKKWCRTDEAGSKFLQEIYEEWELSARSYYKILKVARTIADYEHEENILLNHIKEAVFYRSAERKLWHKGGDVIWN